MDSMTYVIIGIALIAAFLFFRNQQGGIQSVSAGDAAKLQKDTNTVFVDVRTMEEWRAGHIPKAVHIPLHELGARTGELDKYKGKTLVVYCRSGNRSSSATKLLLSKGFKAQNMSGGILAWSESLVR